MASDIIPMDPWKAQCPCCNCQLEVEWQLATYSDGGDSPQFVGLKQVEPPTIHNPITGNDYPVQPRKRVSFLTRRDDQPAKRVPFNIKPKKRTIKTPPKPRPTSLSNIKEAVKKAPPKRVTAKALREKTYQPRSE